MKHEPGFDEEKWQAYVDAGYCPSVDNKTYCNGLDDHPGRHIAHYRDASGHIVMTHYWSHA